MEELKKPKIKKRFNKFSVYLLEAGNQFGFWPFCGSSLNAKNFDRSSYPRFAFTMEQLRMRVIFVVDQLIKYFTNLH